MRRIFLLILLQINIAFISYGFIEPVNVPNHINFTAQLEVSRDVGVEALSQGNGLAVSVFEY